jgi:hypothetical protein
VRTSQAPEVKHANDKNNVLILHFEISGEAPQSVAAASLATKAKRKSAAPIPANGFAICHRRAWMTRRVRSFPVPLLPPESHA